MGAGHQWVRGSSMIGKKKLATMTAAAAVAAGAAIAIIGLAGGAAHAQAATSLTITGMAVTGPVGSPESEVLVTVTCPAGTYAMVYTTGTQGGFYNGHTSEFICTGNLQNEFTYLEPVSGTSGPLAAGPVSAGATLWLSSGSAQELGTLATVTYP